MTATQRLAVCTLKSNRNVIIKPADKGGTVMDCAVYSMELHGQLNNATHYEINDPRERV